MTQNFCAEDITWLDKFTKEPLVFSRVEKLLVYAYNLTRRLSNRWFVLSEKK